MAAAFGRRLRRAGRAPLFALGVVCVARAPADRLFGLSLADPATWACAALLVGALALAACWLPARRAAATDPAEVLRRS